MQAHYEEKATGYEVKARKGFTTPRRNAFISAPLSRKSS